MDERTLREVDAVIAKLITESSKAISEPRWLPLVTAAAIFVSALGLLELLK